MITIGIDVSKNKLDVCWLKEPATNQVKSKVFDHTESGHKALMIWLEKQTQQLPEAMVIIMEATGIYHEALAYRLSAAGAGVSVADPMKVHHFARSYGVRSKTDKKDSVILARYGHQHQPAIWQPEAPEIRQLKALVKRLEMIERDIRREKNRQEKARISQTSQVVLTSIETMLQSLNEQKGKLNKAIDNHIDRNPELKKNRQ